MKSSFPAFLVVFMALVALTAGTATAQSQAPKTIEASATIAPTTVEPRAFCLQHIGRQLTHNSALRRDLCSLLTPNKGSLEYFPETSTLVVADTTAVLDTIAKVLAARDTPPTQIMLDFKIVELADYRTAVQALAGTSPTTQGGAITIDATAATAALKRLQAAGNKIVQTPKLVALAGQTASIFVGDRTPGILQNDGSVASKLGKGTIDLATEVEVLPGTDLVRLDLQLRSLLTSTSGVVTWPILMSSGQTAVLQKFARPDRGALVFVTAHVIADSATPLSPTPAPAAGSSR